MSALKSLRRVYAIILSASLLLGGCAERGVIPSETVTCPATETQTTTTTETSAVSTVPTTVTEATTTLPPEPEYYTVHLVCAGDNLIHSSIYNQAKRRAAANGEEGYDFGYVYERVEHYIKDADLAILIRRR